MSGLLQNAEQQFIDSNGNPLVAGTVDFYIPNTTTRKNTWQDEALTVLNTNPVVLDSNGRAIIWGNGSYRQVVKDQFGNLLWDQITDAPFDSAALANTVGAGGTVLIGFDGGTLANFLQLKNDRIVDSISALAALNPALYTKAYVTGYYSAADGGGGAYSYNSGTSQSLANGGSIIASTFSGATGCWLLEGAARVNVRQFGAKGDNSTDDTNAINAAYASLSTTGGHVYWPNGQYKTSAPIVVYSQTRTEFSAGASMAPVPIASFTPIQMPGHGAWGYGIFVNKNFGATTLTDVNIFYKGVNFIPSAAWNGHVIVSRYITNLQITDGYGDNAADYCSVLACHQVLVADNYCNRASNCAYDFWDGNIDVIISNNFAMLNKSAGININSVGTFNEDRASYNFLVQGNTLQSAGGTLAGSLIFVSPLSAGSTLQDIKIIDNHIDQNGGTGANSPNGVTVQRTKDAVVSNNTIINIGAGSLAVIVSADSFPGVSDGCTVTNNRLVDSFIGAQSMIGVFGTNHFVEGNKAINSSAIGGNGIQVDDPTTIVRVNDMIGATIDVQNSHAGGGATAPAAQATWDRTNSRWYFRQRIRTDVALSQLPDYAITATGTNLATAYAIKSAYSYFSTVAAGTGAALPSAAVALGEEKVIWNQGANALTVYAQSGETIGGAGSISVAGGAKVRLVALQNAFWIQS